MKSDVIMAWKVTMAAGISILKPFVSMSESWKEYLKIMEYFFAANGINDKKSVLIQYKLINF